MQAGSGSSPAPWTAASLGGASKAQLLQWLQQRASADFLRRFSLAGSPTAARLKKLKAADLQAAYLCWLQEGSDTGQPSPQQPESQEQQQQQQPQLSPRPEQTPAEARADRLRQVRAQALARRKQQPAPEPEPEPPSAAAELARRQAEADEAMRALLEEEEQTAPQRQRGRGKGRGKAAAGPAKVSAKRLVKLSKAMSYLLRHGAAEAGLAMQPGGHVELRALLMQPTLRGCTVEEVETIVATNDKQRFALKTDADGVQV
jgi:hypothetical protein